MSGCAAKNTISELVLSAVFYLQQKNGVSVMEVAEYIGEKHCCSPCKISQQIKVVLNKAKEHGIMSESRGKYRIEGRYEDKLEKDELKPQQHGNGDEQGKDDPCAGLDFDQDGEHRHKHKYGEGENRPSESKLEDSIWEGALLDEDDYREREVGEPVSKKRRRMHMESRDVHDYAEEEDEDGDSDNCVLDEF